MHAVVCDLDLPVRNAVELAREIKRAFGCRVAVVSGDPPPDGALPEGIDRWVEKPVSLPRLREVVEALAIDR